MSVFQSIKGTFAAGLKSITSKDHSHGGHTQLNKFGVNLDAGADLLNKYQCTWQELHEAAQQNAQKAQDIDCMITDVYVNYDRQNDVLARLHEELANLPVILGQLQDLTDVLASLEEEYDKVEVGLARLESTCEDQDLAKAKNIDAQKLARYKERKIDEIEKIKVQFAKDHAKKMQNYEKERQTKLKDRQEAFEEAFKDDLDYYKSHGRIDTLSTSSTDSGKRVDLAEIDFENEDKALDEFLGTESELADDKEEIVEETKEENDDENEEEDDPFDEEERPEVDVTSIKESETGSEKLTDDQDNSAIPGKEDDSKQEIQLNSGNEDTVKKEVDSDKNSGDQLTDTDDKTPPVDKVDDPQKEEANG